MKVFSVITGKTRIEFSVWKTNHKIPLYQGRINGRMIYESYDYSEVSDIINEILDANVPYVGATH